jgi:hypothetical protein
MICVERMATVRVNMKKKKKKKKKKKEKKKKKKKLQKVETFRFFYVRKL